MRRQLIRHSSEATGRALGEKKTHALNEMYGGFEWKQDCPESIKEIMMFLCRRYS